MPSTLAIITDMFHEPAVRQRAIGFWAGTSGVGIALGPIIGGLLLVHFWWGSVFLINVPIAVIGIVAGILLVPDSENDAALRPDLAGALLSIAGLGLVLWAIIAPRTEASPRWPLLWHGPARTGRQPGWACLPSVEGQRD